MNEVKQYFMKANKENNKSSSYINIVIYQLLAHDINYLRSFTNQYFVFDFNDTVNSN